MGTLVRTAGRVLGAGILALAGTGILVLTAAGSANAQPASSTACQQISTAVSSLLAAFPASGKASPSAVKKEAAAVARQLTQAASTGSPAVKSAVAAFVADIETGANAGHFDTPKLNADITAIGAACASSRAPRGGPNTGGGSAAGAGDTALFGLGGAAVLAGTVTLVLGLARRSRPRTGAEQG
jgi:hypothetical protein